jgi:hypothetical protein
VHVAQAARLRRPGTGWQPVLTQKRPLISFQAPTTFAFDVFLVVIEWPSIWLVITSQFESWIHPLPWYSP